MGYAGLARGGQRADLINYLHTLVGQPGPAAEGGRSRAAAPDGCKELASRRTVLRDDGRALPGRLRFEASRYR